ncbi:hypothetical protein [Bryobacter aggregatus]|uniref:hypothetical protein n=1 Tax=Bryobacter aggregatus TaxID=360054 RepID=UPI0004E1E798|nr:hypothetical protein [Bryobacter aggregatus]
MWFLVFRCHASELTALLCMIAVAYFPQMQDAYFGAHIVYDTLASLFGWAAYVCLKRAGNRYQLVILGLFLYQLALGAKEVSVCIPFVFLFWKDWRSALLLAPQTIWYLVRKSAMTANGGYSLEFSIDRLHRNLSWYLGWVSDFTILDAAWWQIAIVASLPLLLALLLRDRRPLLGWWLILVVSGLLLFAYKRNIYVFFIAVPGLGFCLLPLLEKLQSLGRPVWVPAMLCYCLLIAFWNVQRGEKYRVPFYLDSAPVREVMASEQYRKLQVPAGGLVVVEQDSFPFDDYNLQMLLSLRMHDERLRVVRLKYHPMPAEKVDAVVRFP